MSRAAVALVALAAFAAWTGGTFALGNRHGTQAEAASRDAANLKRTQQVADDSRLQHAFMETMAGQHAAQLADINDQKGIVRETIIRLPGRACLDAGTVGVLNATGTAGGAGAVRAAASQPAGAPEAVATDRAVAEQIAACRTQHGELSSQLNRILDIEDRRHPLRPAPAAVER